LASVDLHGRFERVGIRPDVWIDVGHNPMGARVVAKTLQDRVGGRRTIRCVLAMLDDKDAEGVAAELDCVIDVWFCAGLSGDRGQSGARLAERVAAVVDPSSVRSCERVAQALRAALAASSDDDAVLVFGSFHTADEADREMINSAHEDRATG
jgi:dihydrofolate synthase/folylpolyglutamate synthase